MISDQFLILGTIFLKSKKTVKNGKPVYLIKNSYGTMVVMSIEAYSRLTDPVETALDLADTEGASSSKRLNAEEVFSAAKKTVNG